MIATFEERRTTALALQLTPDTIDELCRWTLGHRLGADRWIPSEGCWRVSALRWYPVLPETAAALNSLGMLLVGIRTRDGERVVYEDDWVVQASHSGGGFEIVRADRFGERYTAVQP